MDLATKVGEAVELVSRTRLYGREREVMSLLLTGDFNRALQLCSEAADEDYQLLPGVSPWLSPAYRVHLERALTLKCSIAELCSLRSSSSASNQAAAGAPS